ncbi:MAG: hypothetical protein ACRDL1_05105 [Solirubrobacterales bacterium]
MSLAALALALATLGASAPRTSFLAEYPDRAELDADIQRFLLDA